VKKPIPAIITITIFFILLTSIAYCCNLDSWTPTKGDIYGLVPLKISNEYLLATIRCPDRIPVYHWEVVFDNEYSCTSAPPKGCDHCISIWNRINGDWSRIIVMRRKIPFTDTEITEMERLKATECSYDQVGLYLQWVDFVLSCSRWSNFRALWQWPMYYHCLSYTALVAGFDKTHTILPWDILESDDWKVIVDCEL